MKQLQKILLALFVWGVTAIGNSFAQSSADTTESNFITAARAYHTNKDMVVGSLCAPTFCMTPSCSPRLVWNGG